MKSLMVLLVIGAALFAAPAPALAGSKRTAEISVVAGTGAVAVTRLPALVTPNGSFSVNVSFTNDSADPMVNPHFEITVTCLVASEVELSYAGSLSRSGGCPAVFALDEGSTVDLAPGDRMTAATTLTVHPTAPLDVVYVSARVTDATSSASSSSQGVNVDRPPVPTPAPTTVRPTPTPTHSPRSSPSSSTEPPSAEASPSPDRSTPPSGKQFTIGSFVFTGSDGGVFGSAWAAGGLAVLILIVGGLVTLRVTLNRNSPVAEAPGPVGGPPLPIPVESPPWSDDDRGHLPGQQSG